MSDRLIFAVHAAFWAAFCITLLVNRGKSAPAEAPTVEPAVPAKTAPYSRALVGFHMTAFGVLYFGINMSVLPNQVMQWWPYQQWLGTAVIALGAVIACWALAYFRSWRFRAQLDSGHQLATGGPFSVLRHPIYAALDLLAVGSLLWVPNVVTAVGTVMMFIGSDLRGRSEEKLLLAQFPVEYPKLMKRAKRFIPFVY
ncbi:MAG: isoprenylcysteine carboxylmethyltransferase family protein [Myxococcaceae bacterium]